MPLFLDVNVWLPLVWEGHVAVESAHRWAETQTEELAFCRVTQLALLRHLTNPAILGDDVLTNTGAKQMLEAILVRDEVTFRGEPPGLDLFFPRLGETSFPMRNRWTDAYLAAFAIAANFEFVTYDRDFVNFEPDGLRWTLLEV